MDIFTICSANYVNRAVSALESHKRFHPDDTHHLILCETQEVLKVLPIPGWINLQTIFDISLPAAWEMIRRYDILELNTAVKPFVFRDLFLSGSKCATYIDPDVHVYRPLYSVETFGSDAVVTPHILKARPDGKFPDMLQSLRCGQFNFGYLSLTNTRNTGNFLAWWADKMVSRCVKDFSNGIFVDQSWGAGIVSLMDKVHIERTPGSHCAYWNLRGEDLWYDDGRYYVEGQPLTMFHFSGFNLARPERLSCHTERFNPIPKNSPLESLVKEYVKDVNTREDASPVSQIAYTLPPDPNAREASPPGFREAFVRRTWECLGFVGDSGEPKKIAVYGAGKHTVWLERVVSGVNPAPIVVAVLDDGPERKIDFFGIKTTIKPESIDLDNIPFDVVVTSSDIPTNARRMMNRAFYVLKEQVKIVNLYDGCPPGQYT